MGMVIMARHVFHFYIPAMVNRVERWLSSMSQDGWILTQQKGFRFTFEEQKPAYREYFMYSGFDLSKGFSDQYFWAEKVYRNRKSALRKDPTIFEIDLNRKDGSLEKTIHSRNNFYRNHYIKLLLFVVAITIPVIPSAFKQVDILWVLTPAFLIMLYALFSLAIIMYDKRYYKIKRGKQS